MPDLTFTAPPGFKAPENLDSDNTFQAMATFKMIGEAELELIDIEGYPISEDEEDQGEESVKETEAANASAALQDAASAASAEQNMGGSPGGTQSGMGETPPAGTQAGFAQQMAAKFRKATGKR